MKKLGLIRRLRREKGPPKAGKGLRAFGYCNVNVCDILKTYGPNLNLANHNYRFLYPHRPEDR